MEASSLSLAICSGIGAHMIIGDLDEGLGQTDDEGVGLAIGALMVVAEDGLEPLGLDQIGQRLDVLHRDAALDQDRGGQT